jgi:hypothetical protein
MFYSGIVLEKITIGATKLSITTLVRIIKNTTLGITTIGILTTDT